MSEQVVSLAERLKARREELGLSQAQAARELDVARTAYRLWEMEAARPSPDRWRLISRWLGVSVTTMLLAEELLSDDEAVRGEVAEHEFARLSGRAWDTAAAESPGDFFAQARAVIADGTSAGFLTAEQTVELTGILERIEQEQQQAATDVWEAAEFRKAFPANAEAPRAASHAVALVAAGIPDASLSTARRLTRELVASCVEHGEARPSAYLGLFVAVNRRTLRIEISRRPPEGSPRGKGAVPAADVLDDSSRWGTDESDGLTITWFELDLPTPGSAPAPR